MFCFCLFPPKVSPTIFNSEENSTFLKSHFQRNRKCRYTRHKNVSEGEKQKTETFYFFLLLFYFFLSFWFVFRLLFHCVNVYVQTCNTRCSTLHNMILLYTSPLKKELSLYPTGHSLVV